jgi:hypothetical protein
MRGRGNALALRTVKYFGRVDMVVNNAGIGGDDQLLRGSNPQDW